MMKMISIKKQSKSKQRKYYSSKRGSWNGIAPVARIMQSRKAYDRNRIKQEDHRTRAE